MLVFHECLSSLGIRACVNILEVVSNHCNSVRCHEFNVSCNPLHCINLLENSVTTSSDDLDHVVSLLVDESLEEQPNVIHLRHSAVDLVNTLLQELKTAVERLKLLELLKNLVEFILVLLDSLVETGRDF